LPPDPESGQQAGIVGLRKPVRRDVIDLHNQAETARQMEHVIFFSFDAIDCNK